MIKLKSYAAKTDQGPYLQVNEDGYDVDLVNDLFMVLDGFGGAGVGDKAVNDLKENLKTFYTKIGSDPDSTLPFFFSSKYLLEGNALVNAIEYSHQSLVKENEKYNLNERGGASAIMACLAENIMTIASVGNCVAYIDRRGYFEKILQEDSLRMVGGVDFDSPHTSCPLSGFGLFKEVHYKIAEIRIQEGDSVIFLTDGAYQKLKPKDIKHHLENADINLSEKIDNLFSLANEKGNLDNQTAILLKF